MGLCDEELSRCKAELRRLDDEIRVLKTKKSELEDKKTDLEVAIKNDKVGQQIRDLEKEIRVNVEKRNKRQLKADEYNKLVRIVNLIENPVAFEFEKNREVARNQKDSLQKQLEKELSDNKRQIQNELDCIKLRINERIETIKSLRCLML